MKQVVSTLNDILEFKISTKIGPRRESDSKYVVSNSDKFKAYFSWKPKYNNLKYILQTALDWEKKNNYK